jgi:hypothetical protein
MDGDRVPAGAKLDAERRGACRLLAVDGNDGTRRCSRHGENRGARAEGLKLAFGLGAVRSRKLPHGEVFLDRVNGLLGVVEALVAARDVP